MGPAKTGWTVASRHTYAAAVTRNGRELLLTLLDSPNKWADAQILFNWGFAQSSSERQANTPAASEVPVPPPASAPSGTISSVTTSPPVPAKKKKHPKPAGSSAP